MKLNYIGKAAQGTGAANKLSLRYVGRDERDTNKGGLLGGIGYIGEKLGAGFMQSVEGIWDYAAGGIADLFGADDWAKAQFDNDWFGDWYNKAGDWYNPSDAMKVAGDVAGGIGTTLPTVVGALGATLISGGTLAPAAVTAIGSTIAGLGAAGTATKEAYRETGELTGKEYGYGALVGATEAALEGVTGMIGAGSGRALKAIGGIGKKAAKEGAEAAAKTAAKKGLEKVIGSTVKHIGKDFVSEAVEEGLAEIAAPYYARMTYDPTKENATAEEIAYASFVGGLAGVIMGGATTGVQSTVTAALDNSTGNEAVNNGYAPEILSTARMIAESEESSPSGYTLFADIAKTYRQLGDGEIKTANQKRLLGKLQRMTAVSRVLPSVEESAVRILNDPETAIERFSALRLDEQGVSVTPEELTKGIDLASLKPTEITEDMSKRDVKKAVNAQRIALRRAISTNPTLLTLAVADATGRLMVDAEAYTNNALSRGSVGTRGDYQNFIATATPEQKAAIASRFGLERGLDATAYEDFSSAADAYAATDEGRRYIRSSARARMDAEAIPANNRAVPRVIGEGRKDGVMRYGDVAVIKEGAEVRLYDYASRTLSSPMTTVEATAALQKYHKSAEGRRYAISESGVATDAIKGTEATSPSPSVDNYTEEQYNNYGWARANGVLTTAENAHYRSQFAAAVAGGNKYRRTKSGEIMIPVSDGSDATERKIVYAKGTIDDPIITRVLEIDLDNNTEIDPRRREVYENERRGIQQKTGGIFRRYDSADFPYQSHQGNANKIVGHHDGSRFVRGAGRGKTQRVVGAHLNEDGSTTYTYADGTTKRLALPEDGKNTAERATAQAGAKTNIDTWAREHVKAYGELNAIEQREIRSLVRQARALGIPEADIEAYATVSARSGVRITFSKERALVGRDKAGQLVYADGFYDPATNEIVVNPEGKRSAGKLLLHELAHALYKVKKFGNAIDKIVRRMDEERATDVAQRYAAYGVEVASEEVAVHHAEDVLGNRDNLSRLLRDEPTIGDKILSFFGLARTEYNGVQRLSRAAGRLYRHFEKAFTDFAARNKANLAAEVVTSGETKMDLSDVDKTLGTEYNRGTEKIGGEDGTQESRNAGVLEHERVPTARRGENGLWEQSGNTKSLQGILGYDDAYVRKNNIRAGESGWLEDYHGANGYGNTNDRRNSKRFFESVRRNLSETTLKRTDTVGRDVPQKIIDSFAKTVFKSEDGTILSLWHWTNARFSDFKYGDIGFHAGTFDSSRKVMDAKKSTAGKGYFKELYVNSQNPFFVDRDLTHWTPYMVVEYCGILDSDQYSAFSELKGQHVENYDSPASKFVRSALKQKGYDAIIYPNEWEGGISVIVFDNEQFYTVAENGMLVDVEKKKRFALPEDATYVSPTVDSVGKERSEYQYGKKDAFITAKDRIYIQTVDEMYGAEKYLRRVGGVTKENAEAIVQMARSARNQAQTMIGDVQYNVFSDDPERMGDGLLEIYKPTRHWSVAKHMAFEDYLLHRLNIDRMTLESRSRAWAAPLQAEVTRIEIEIADLTNEIKAYKASIRKADTAINNAKVRRGIVKTEAAKARWQDRIDAFVADQKTAISEKSKGEAKLAKLEKDREKAKAAYDSALLKNKPVFGAKDEEGTSLRDHDITAEESREYVRDYEAEYPDFEALAEKVYDFLRNNQKLRVEAGLITQEDADYMAKLYPHYVPSRRDKNSAAIISPIRGKNDVEISSTIRRAKGGNEDILDIGNSIAAQTEQLIKAGQINRLARDIYDAAHASGDTTYVRIIAEEDATMEEEKITTVLRPKQGQITFYKDGKRVTMEVSSEILVAFDAIHQPTIDLKNPLEKGAAMVNKWFKAGVTSMNPFFGVRNMIRDLQDAGLNSRHPARFAKEYFTGAAARDMIANSKEWQLYRAMGGFASTVFDGSKLDGAGYAGFEAVFSLFQMKGASQSEMMKAILKLPKSILNGISNINAFIEQVTRFAEFKASLKAGDSPMVAINNSAEVTTNFGRRGKLTKKLNATIMPFLNPAVQSFDKIFRNIGDIMTKEKFAKGITRLITTAVIIGLVPMIFNSLMYDDDEDYKILREVDKENNFLIKTGDGKFIKIPRGRLASVIGGLYNRGAKLAKGEDADLGGYVANVATQITPFENMTSFIFSPLYDASHNRTWYGGEIEGQEFDDTSPRNRKDETTSPIAIFIADSINATGIVEISPKKVHYVLDQYSGVIGDVFLPIGTSKEQRGLMATNFTIDATTSNKLSTQFYDLYDKTTYANTEGDDTAKYRLKYLNTVKKTVKKINDEIDVIRNDTTIKNAEKLERVRVLRALINVEYSGALSMIDKVDAAIKSTVSIEAEALAAGNSTATAETLRDTEVTRLVFGAERAIKEYDEKLYEKYKLFNATGISYETLFDFYFSTVGLDSDMDREGNVVSGSKRNKVIKAINSLGVSSTQKVLLMAAKGYTVKDGDIRGVSADRAQKILISAIKKTDLKSADKEALAKALGFKVKNGRIILS